MLKVPHWRAWGALVTIGVITVTPPILHQIGKPPQNTVDGVYASGCCTILTIRGGVLLCAGKQYRLQLENMKFGLTGYVDGSLDDGAGGQVTTLLFRKSGPDLSFTTVLEGREQTFSRIARRASAA